MNNATITKLADVEWVKTDYLKNSEEGPVENHTFDYSFWLPSYLASWDVWSYWERELIESMRENLIKGDVLFDIGAEFGWMSLVFADMVGAENMVLIEPTPEFWPNIKATWEKNDLSPPLATYAGLMSDKEFGDTNSVFSKGWLPNISDNLIDKMAYRYIHNNQQALPKNQIPETKLDTLVFETAIVPSALVIDVEGAELSVLRGAEKVLKKYKPIIWLSIHPDLSERDYGVKEGECQKYLKKLGYKAEWLSTDHEEHWLFKHEGRK